MQALEDISGIPRPRITVPYTVGWTLISSLHLIGSLIGRPYHVDPVVVEMANHFWYIHSQDAMAVLECVTTKNNEKVKK